MEVIWEVAILQVEVIKQQQCSTSVWSGGTTTQLYIYPEGLTVKDEFLFRISSATVAPGEAIFSDFSKYQRFLTLLKGEMCLQHDSKSAERIRPFEKIFFDGSLQTKSYSEKEIVDFNIIWRKELQVPQIEIVDARLEARRLTCKGHIFIYNYEKNAKISFVGQKICSLEAGELLVSNLENSCEVILQGRLILLMLN